MIAAPPRRRKKNKNDVTRNRAQTYNVGNSSNYQNGYNNNKNNNNNNNNNNQQAHTDDLLDLFGMNDNTNNNNNNNTNNNGNTNTNNTNLFDDPFWGTTTNNNNTNNNNNNNNNNNSYTNGNNNNVPVSNVSHNNVANNNINNVKSDMVPIPKRKKKKKNKKTKKQRANTVAASNNNQNNNKAMANKAKPIVKMKKIDVLPLLHKGIRANKFKLNGNKSKVRTFYLNDTNFYFCWEAVGGNNQKGGIFSKKSDKSTRSKIDKDRSIPIRSIKSLQKRTSYEMQKYNFIPQQQKSLALSIVYIHNGSDKKLNFMAYEPFHHQLFYDGLQQLIAAARDPKRNLNQVFELYVDFRKEILPKHLRPQRFKWEPLGDNDYSNNGNNNDNNDDNNNNNLTGSFDNGVINGIDVYDPTTHGQYGRSRIQSF